MTNNFSIERRYFSWFSKIVKLFKLEWWVIITSTLAAFGATAYSFFNNYIISYGDAESHLNIAKRVIDSLTPGFAQLGGIWLPLPHILLIPFVYSDYLWRTGLAGSIVSGVAFVVSALFICKTVKLLTGNNSASFLAAFVFISNPNILYLQSTPMTEPTLVAFFILSSYYFIKFLLNDGDLLNVILAAFFGFMASLSRYDGWSLVLMEVFLLCVYYFPFDLKFLQTWHISIINIKKSFSERWHLLEGRLILFSTLGFFGIVLWLLWGFLILGDPLYFSHSQFSANSQQHSWLLRGQLPAYHHAFTAFIYYAVTSFEIIGAVVTLIALVGLIIFCLDRRFKSRYLIALLLFVPFFFNVATLFLGQSVIFIPGLTPNTFEWILFNVRYGVLMIPAASIFAGYLFSRLKIGGTIFTVFLVILQIGLFLIGFSPVLTLDDGVSGLSSATAKMPDAQFWLASHYDYGKVITDDFARTISIIRTPIRMQDDIYIGNKPYWEESLVTPEKHARWVIMQRDDTLWKNILDKPEIQARLFKYFNKVYTSDNILIFKRIDNPPQQ